MGRPCDARGPAVRSRWWRLGAGRAWIAVVLATVIALGGVVVSAARADGDPASDELIASNVFYPYSSPAPQPDQTELNRAVAVAHRDGLALKVAIIARASDLGSITELFGRPQVYAHFLDTEISLSTPQPLLVVMANGDGVEGLPAREQRSVLASPRTTGHTGAALAVAALGAVRRIDDDLGPSPTAVAAARLPPVLLPALVLAAAFAVALLVTVSTVFPAT